MPVLLGRIDRINVNCLIWAGRVSRAEALGFPAAIDARQSEFGCRWISYFHPMADLSGLDSACLLELRERLRPIVASLDAKCEFRMMLVSSSRYNAPLLSVWTTIAGTDASYLSNPVLVADIESAAPGLDLSPADAEHARLWIESRLAALSGESS